MFDAAAVAPTEADLRAIIITLDRQDCAYSETDTTIVDLTRRQDATVVAFSVPNLRTRMRHTEVPSPWHLTCPHALAQRSERQVERIADARSSFAGAPATWGATHAASREPLDDAASLPQARAFLGGRRARAAPVVEAITTIAATGTDSQHGRDSGSSSGSSSRTKRRVSARSLTTSVTPLAAALSPEPSIPRELLRSRASGRERVLSSPFSRALSSVG